MKIEELKEKYLRETEANKSSIYGQLGAWGISQEHLKMYEDSMKKIEEYKSSFDITE